MQKIRYQIGVGGGMLGVVLFALLILSIYPLVVIYGTLRVISDPGVTLHSPISIIYMVFYLWLLYYLKSSIITSNKLGITKQNFFHIKNKGGYNIIPKAETKTIPLCDIKGVYVDSLGNLDLSNEGIIRAIKPIIKNMNIYSLPPTITFMPVIQIVTKGGTDDYIISAKPYSKKALKKLFAELEKGGIPTKFFK